MTEEHQTHTLQNSDANNNLTQAENKKVFEAYLEAYANLSPDSLESTLSPLLSDDIEFKDPFNHVHTKKEALAIFEHMFATTFEPTFTVKLAQLSKNMGFAYWQFSFKSKENGEFNHITGTSLIEINPQGMIQKHIDFWDPAEQLYEKIPVLGWVMRSIKKRLSAQQH